MNKIINLVTGNTNKYKSAKEKLSKYDISVLQEKLDIVEPQEEDIIAVAKFKVNEAYRLTQSPVLVSDSGWSIPSLKGFPGPYMHYISDWFEADDFLNLMRDKKDRTVELWNVLAFSDGKDIKVFNAKRVGRMLEEVKGKGINVDQLVTFRKDNLSIAECNAQDVAVFDDKDFESIWTTFGKWYSSI